MIALSLADIARITGGALVNADDATAGRLVVDGGVVTDSRDAGPGSLYVARIGAALDGHDFVVDAAARGAVAAVTRRVVGDLPAVVVSDEQAAFVAIARAVIDRAQALTVIAVTGSSGKTTTKDLLGQVLVRAGETVSPVGSLNSEVGVPLTVCRVTTSTRFLVVEMGARGLGHIDYLTRIAPPRIGIVLNIGSAHVGEFGSRDAIATAKAELVAALPPDGLAVLNADDAAVAAMARGTSARVVLVGESPKASVRARDVAVDGAGRARFVATTPVGAADVHLAVTGRHQVGNALAVLATALEVGIPLEDAAAALASAGPVSRYRMEVRERGDGVTIVNDAYNANPESMRAALAALAVMGRDRRSWAVLGPMLELGDEAEEAHTAIGREVVADGVDNLVAVGDGAAGIAAGALAAATSGRPTVRAVPDLDAAYALLHEDLRPGDIVLVKSSNGAGLRFLGDRLLLGATPPAETTR